MIPPILSVMARPACTYIWGAPGIGMRDSFLRWDCSSIKSGLAQWHRLVMDVWSWRAKMAKQVVHVPHSHCGLFLLCHSSLFVSACHGWNLQQKLALCRQFRFLQQLDPVAKPPEITLYQLSTVCLTSMYLQHHTAYLIYGTCPPLRKRECTYIHNTVRLTSIDHFGFNRRMSRL